MAAEIPPTVDFSEMDQLIEKYGLDEGFLRWRNGEVLAEPNLGEEHIKRKQVLANVRMINEAILAGKTVTASLADGVDGLLVAVRIGAHGTLIGIFQGEQAPTFYKPDCPPGVQQNVTPKAYYLFHVFEFPVFSSVTIHEIKDPTRLQGSVLEEWELCCTCGKDCPIHHENTPFG
jgi:hypothetical protein